MAWFLLFFSGEIWGLEFQHAAETVVALSLVSIASCFLTLVVLNILGRKGLVSARSGGSAFFLFGTLLSIGTIGISYTHSVWPLFIASCILVGTSGAFFACAAVLQLARLEARNILIACGLIFLVGIFIYSFAFYVPRELTIPILCTLPLIACVFFVFDKTEVFFIEQQANEAPSSRAPLGWRSVVLLSVFMLFSCVVRGYLPFSMDNEFFSYIRSFSIILMLIAGAVTVVVPLLLPDNFRLSNIFRIVFIVGVVFFALLPIFGMNNPLILILSDAFRGLCALITLTFFATMARAMPFFGFRNVGGGMALYVAFGLVGWLVGTFLYYANFSEDVLRIYSSIQCALVLLAFILLYRQQEVESFVDRSLAKAVPVDSDTESFDKPLPSEAETSGGKWRQHCKAIAKEHGLTAREEEVFILLAKGFKAQNISERLSVSYNTTRAHIRNIYQKCGVHSQQEFIELIEAPSDQKD